MNEVKDWSWEKPTEPGIYICCHGDVETAANMWMLSITELGQSYVLTDQIDMEDDISNYTESVKYAKLTF